MDFLNIQKVNNKDEEFPVSVICNTWTNGKNQNSKLSEFNKKCFNPMTTKPSSFLQGFFVPFTMIIFLKESGIFLRDLDS